jgi:hypothetical protein
MLLPTIASAQFRLRVEAVGTGQGLVISDGVPGDGDPDGSIFSTFLIATGESDTTGQISPAWTPADGEFANLHLNQITISSTGAATVRLTLENAGYTDAGHFLLNSSVINGNWGFFGPTPPGSSMTVTSWVNTSNAVPSFGPDGDYSVSGGIPDLPVPFDGISTSSQTFLSADGDAFSGNATSAAFTPGALGYSLWTDIVMQFGELGGTLTFDQFTTVTRDNGYLDPGTGTPEPGSLLLIGTGVVALAGRMRRRKLTHV